MAGKRVKPRCANCYGCYDTQTSSGLLCLDSRSTAFFNERVEPGNLCVHWSPKDGKITPALQSSLEGEINRKFPVKILDDLGG